jgi:integral membrane protein
MQKESLKISFRRFRLVGIAEGISFLLLLLIAMPLKYFFDVPEAVKIAGWVHGALFIAFIWFAFDMMGSLKKPFSWFAKSFAAAILPFGTFVFDSQLKKEEKVLRS